MRAVEITAATLAEYGRCVRKDMWVLTRGGKPIAALVPIDAGQDLESFGLSHDRRFINLLNRSWASYERQGGTTLEEMRRRHTRAHRGQRRRKRR